MKKQKHFGLSALLLSLGMSLFACWDWGDEGDSDEPRKKEEQKKENEPYGPFDPNHPDVKALLGFWSTGDIRSDSLWSEEARAHWGIGVSGGGYDFKEDGRYAHALVISSVTVGFNGYYLFHGNYRVSGNQIVLYNTKAGCTDWYSPKSSYRNKPTGDETVSFVIEPYNVPHSENTERITITDSRGSRDSYCRSDRLPKKP